MLRNPGVLFQTLAQDACFISAFRCVKGDLGAAKVLDVGCGAGSSIINLLRLGFDPGQIYGIDIIEGRIAAAKQSFPNSNWVHGDARHMPFSSQTIDVVMESTMFVAITDDSLSSEIAHEMIRVTKPNGYIILFDWRYSKPWSRDYLGLSTRRVHRIFGVEEEGLIIEKMCKGALIPPIGRFISARFPAAYFLMQSAFPFLAGERAIVMRRTPKNAAGVRQLSD